MEKLVMKGMMLAAVLMVGSAYAAKIYHITGTVTHLDSKTVTVNADGENYEFDRHSKSVNLPSSLKQGDAITVQYSMDAKQIIQGHNGQAAGVASPGEVAPDQKTPSPDDIKKGIIEDDRTSYGA